MKKIKFTETKGFLKAVIVLVIAALLMTPVAFLLASTAPTGTPLLTTSTLNTSESEDSYPNTNTNGNDEMIFYPDDSSSSGDSSSSSGGGSQTYTNTPPNTPDKPYGSSVEEPGEQCVFITSTVDPDGDLVYYMWDWDDRTSGEWTGPYGSGVEAGSSHTWDDEGIYEVRVKAKDEHGLESEWSESLFVNIRFLLGDMNEDGCINFCDIDPFVLGLVNPEEFKTQYGFDPYIRGDCNEDGRFDSFDIDSFVQLLYECGHGCNRDLTNDPIARALNDLIGI
jgi:hypothetical protein